MVSGAVMLRILASRKGDMTCTYETKVI